LVDFSNKYSYSYKSSSEYDL